LRKVFNLSVVFPFLTLGGELQDKRAVQKTYPKADMNTCSQFAFLALILAQAAHSIEEYVFRLYNVFPPARYISSLVSEDLAVGFVIVNAALVLFGLWCYIARVRVNHSSALAWMWLWVVIEFGNGVGHIVIALMRGAYFPGVATAPFLLGISGYLAVRLLKIRRSSPSAT
jgi:hypothetical protein